MSQDYGGRRDGMSSMKLQITFILHTYMAQQKVQTEAAAQARVAKAQKKTQLKVERLAGDKYYGSRL